MNINQYHGSYNRSVRPGGVGAIKYICIHYTAGTGSARNNCIYFSGANRNASADYFVDDAGIWEYNDPYSGYYTWAVGDGRGAYGITNANSISIEVVNNGGDFSNQEIEYLRELVPFLMSKYNVPADRVVRHYDASRKLCPAGYVDQNKWNQLHAVITGGQAPSVTPTPSPAPSTPQSKPVTGSDWVRRLQTECNAQGYSRQAVDGIPGPNTLNGCPQLGRTSKGNITKLMQERLAALGYNPGAIDGINGPNTQAAIKAFQRDKGIGVDGIVGPNTWRKLLGL